MTKKIYIEKDDSLEGILKKIFQNKEKEIILYVPRSAAITRSVSYFNTLKKEAEKAGKSLKIESVDKEALELAALAGLNSESSFFKSRLRPVADILPSRASRAEPRPNQKDKTEEPMREEDDEGADWFEREPEKPGTKKTSPKRRSPLRNFTFIFFLVVILGAGGGAAYFYLPRAEVDLTFKKTDWNFAGELKAQTNLSQLGVSGQIVAVPAKEMDLSKTLTQVYPASGNQYVSKKATGVITVYNAYSTASQILVRTTRFTSPDGHVFRTDTEVVVPGGTLSGGKLIPGKIDVAVTAAAPGADYNIGPTSRFSIPGFQGSAKYNGFYGSSTGSMTGGLVGEAKVPTSEDVKSALQKTETALTQDLQSEVSLQLPSDEKLVAGAGTSTVTKTDSASIADGSGNFAVTVSETYKALAFKEADVLSAFAGEVANQAKTNLVINNYSLNYGSAQADVAHGILSVPLEFKSSWIPAFDSTGFRAKIAGQSETDLRKLILAIPDLESSSVKLWPFWVTRVPKNSNSLKILVR